MPLYEYRCDSCDHKFVHMRSMKDRNTALDEDCPECGENRVFRIYSNAGSIDPAILHADKNMENSGVQAALERIRDNHKDANMKWNG